MSWNIEIRHDGMFTVANQAGHVLFDGAFRPDIPEPTRLRLLNELAESPGTLAMLRLTGGELAGLLKTLVEQHGEEKVKIEAPGLVQLTALIRDQLRAADGQANK